ncbi:hypothetical protein Tco_0781955 [Tanacetum coccineum]
MVRCRICRSPGVIKTSWTPTNPGRCFYCCSKRGINYGIIDWFDPPMCDRAVKIIPGLLRTMNELQEIIAHYRAQETNVENHVEAIAHYPAHAPTVLDCRQVWLSSNFFTTKFQHSLTLSSKVARDTYYYLPLSLSFLSSY